MGDWGFRGRNDGGQHQERGRARGLPAESGVGRKTDSRVKRAESPPPNASPSSVPPVWDVRNRLQENYQRVLGILEEMGSEAESKGKLAAAAELRRHIELADRTLEKTVDHDAQRVFEQKVLAALEALDAVDAEARQKVIDVLNAQVDGGDRERRRETGDRGSEAEDRGRGSGAGGAGRPVAEPAEAGKD